LVFGSHAMLSLRWACDICRTSSVGPDGQSGQV
jgi:hypothetical protein